MARGSRLRWRSFPILSLLGPNTRVVTLPLFATLGKYLPAFISLVGTSDLAVGDPVVVFHSTLCVRTALERKSKEMVISFKTLKYYFHSLRSSELLHFTHH
jgi:hypothetical protein